MTASTRLSLLDRVRGADQGEKGANDAWTQFARIYDGLILNWLRQQGVSAEDAEDVRQEVMSTVYQEIGKFEHNGRTGAFRNWLRKITSNRLHRLWQKRKPSGGGAAKPRLEDLASQLADDNSRLTIVWEQQHDQYLVAKLLSELSERFQPRSIEIFQRVVLRQEPAADVAADLGMTLGAARVAQHRVLRALKTLGRDFLE